MDKRILKSYRTTLGSEGDKEVKQVLHQKRRARIRQAVLTRMLLGKAYNTGKDQGKESPMMKTLRKYELDYR
jgi:hypothetical protein